MITQFFTYDPPYDTPIEEDLAWHLTKHLGEDVDLPKQQEVETLFGTFRLDLVAKPKRGRPVAFECDGKGYHDDTFRDRCRDALILAVDEHAAIYRFRGRDLYYHANDCLYVIARKDPHLFSPRGLWNINLLASDEVKSARGADSAELGIDHRAGYEHGNTLTVYYRDGVRPREFTLVVERRSPNKWLLDAGVLGFLNFALDQEKTTFKVVYHRYLNHLKKS